MSSFGWATGTYDDGRLVSHGGDWDGWQAGDVGVMKLDRTAGALSVCLRHRIFNLYAHGMAREATGASSTRVLAELEGEMLNGQKLQGPETAAEVGRKR